MKSDDTYLTVSPGNIIPFPFIRSDGMVIDDDGMYAEFDDDIELSEDMLEFLADADCDDDGCVIDFINMFDDNGGEVDMTPNPRPQTALFMLTYATGNLRHRDCDKPLYFTPRYASNNPNLYYCPKCNIDIPETASYMGLEETSEEFDEALELISENLGLDKS